MIKFKDINYPRRKEKEIIINLPNEIWKDVCDGYKVSNYGRVLSLAKTTIRGRKYDKILSASKKDNGYYTVSINGNNEYVHRLVAKGFIWRFIDDNDYSIKCKSKIIKIYNGTETIYNSVSEATIKNNVSASAIYNCLYGKSKTCGGYEWIKR